MKKDSKYRLNWALIVTLLSAINSFSQLSSPSFVCNELEKNTFSIESTETQFQKTVPKPFQSTFYTALSFFPELDSVSIRFKEARIKTTLNARPTSASLLFRKRKNRKYIIRVNSKQKDSLILLEDVPECAQIGLFGHELSHFVDYQNRSFGGVLKRMFSYTSKKGKERYEKEIDAMTIDRGLGDPLYCWSDYVLNHSNGNVAYLEYKRIVYLEPEEILEIIQQTAP